MRERERERGRDEADEKEEKVIGDKAGKEGTAKCLTTGSIKVCERG